MVHYAVLKELISANEAGLLHSPSCGIRPALQNTFCGLECLNCGPHC